MNNPFYAVEVLSNTVAGLVCNGDYEMSLQDGARSLEGLLRIETLPPESAALTRKLIDAIGARQTPPRAMEARLEISDMLMKLYSEEVSRKAVEDFKKAVTSL